ncbi:NAD(P)/FAD-dependent oxidoreductase [Caulobacter sp. S45]|uniref:FAD-dependent oxidoreductase n=1 Tax=Caulobacter sp. S45 TaxID=1641861 RepID=UPI00131EB66E|nr:NAD(P)/FAD-dependent oxidoreductase [Caulobacter sp. S45]
MKADPIIIVGAGPTGLATALALGLEGASVVVLEAEPALTIDLRAGSYHPPTVEMLDGLGVAKTMHESGIVVPSWQIRDREAGVVAEFDMSLLKDVTRFPYRLHLEQHRLTPILLDRIRKAAPTVEVRFASPVAGYDQDADGVDVRLEDGSALRGSFLIGADGARSVVRRGMQVGFEGFTWPDRFLVASTSHDLGAHGFSGAGYIADPTHWAAVFHVPDDGPPGLWRIAYPIQAEEDEAEVLEPEAIQDRLKLVLAGNVAAPVGGYPLKYASIYKVHQRVADRFAVGRTVLVGDAAHLNNPLGGLGLNGGIHDAVNLAGKLAPIWREGSDHQQAFDLYDRQRRPVNIKAVQAMSIRNKRILEERDPAVRRQHLHELGATAADPVKAKAYLMESSMINSVRDAAQVH